MNNYLTDEEKEWLKNLKIFENNKSIKYELEIRFTGITKDIYEIIFNEFLEKHRKLKMIESVKLEKILYNRNLSCIQNENVCNIKKRLKWLYLDNIPANITLSTEIIKYIKNENENNYIEREKKRTSFIDLENNISYDFTIINKNIYQIEIEFPSIFSNKDKYVNLINNGIYKIVEILPLNIKKIIKQPVPLKEEKKIHDFAVTEKLDGLRSILYINNDGKVILIKNNFKTRIITNLKIKKNEDYINSYNSTVIDGELIDGKIFYAFDIIFFNGKYLIENLKKRVERLNSFKFISKKGKMDIFYRVKSYYYENIEENSNKILKKKHKHKIDGLIFNSINNNYKNSVIYKWKYTITFDFMIKKNNNIWDIYCYNRNNSYIAFSNFIKNNYKIKSDENLDIKYKDGIIIEFKYDKGNNMFQPIRIRDDKIMPNFINVALDNWECLEKKISFLKY